MKFNYLVVNLIANKVVRLESIKNKTRRRKNKLYIFFSTKAVLNSSQRPINIAWTECQVFSSANLTLK